jgi:predicted secreted protein
MAAIAGSDTTIQVNTGSGLVNLTGIDSITLNDGKELYDITQFNQADSNRRRLAGLDDFTIDLSGHLDDNGSGTDLAAAQKFIRTSKGTGVDIPIQILWDGTVGFSANVKCSAFNIDAPIDGRVGLSITLEGNSAITEIP